ncbi:MAG: TetR/AcrR family transcriptional regulator [Anaerolineae bacterium]|jgi:AcrR family transcriptional regulator|nr:TetR/AcrR family transcriptional regulator [Anaerolineae bacterium]MBT7189363.1 TetR/AcrR family transcriptional regulator [Anaerolineae bacterium]MBT7991723.1 TetR/AcrR family transcriptional regulator [Anaerolineae bacterium]
MVRPKQKEQHPDLENAIKEVARSQMIENGSASLSLRAIARALKITAPAIYNYFPSRDDLVTALIVDAYNSLGDALRLSQASLQKASDGERVFASARAYRNWALAHPEEYNLIFGTPIPNYHAPMEITGPAAAGNMSVLIGVLHNAWQDGVLKTEGVLRSTPNMIQAWINKFGYEGDPVVVQFAMASWSQIHGMLSLEINGHFAAVPDDVDVDDFFEVEIRAMLTRMGLEGE